MARKTYQREFLIPVGPDSQIRFRFDLNMATIDDFVVQYEVDVDGRPRPVIRYDCAHGRPHRDELDSRGLVIDKQWLPRGIPRKEAMAIAQADIRGNWARYRDEFLRRVENERTNQAPRGRGRRHRGKGRAGRRRH